MSIYLGVDYGRKHIGLAIADGPLASPLGTVSGENESAAISKIVGMAAAHEVEGIVVGCPEGVLEAVVKRFANDLASRAPCPVMLHPETLSTKEALAALRAVGAKRKKLQNDHVYAACLILEDYLETKNVVN